MGMARYKKESLHTHWNVEEHVGLIVQVFKTTGVVREVVPAVSCRCIPEQDTLDLTWEVFGHLGVVLHNVTVACVCNKDELPFGEGHEDLLQEKQSYT